MDLIKEVKQQLSSKFDMKDLGLAHFILEMEIERERVNIIPWLSQQKDIEGILKRFNMQDCKLVKVPIPIGTKLSADQCTKSQEEIEYMTCVPYGNAISNLMYAMVNTQPNIAHAVGVLIRYMVTPSKEHWTIVKRVFRYMRGMTSFAIYYHGNYEEVGVHFFPDSNWSGDIYGRWSTSGYVLRLFGGAVGWMNMKQSMVALSTT